MRKLTAIPLKLAISKTAVQNKLQIMSAEGNRIGIVGGGQLGRMLTEAALPMGFAVTVVEADMNCPAAQAGASVIQGGIKDGEAIRRLVDVSDVITWEIEHIDTESLEQIELNSWLDVQPSAFSLSVIKDKFVQKDHFASAGLPVAPYRELATEQDFSETAGDFKSAIVKTRTGGFDGRGNLVIGSQTWQDVIEIFKDTPLYAEEMIDYERELAIIVARDRLGHMVTYPVVETIHKDNICHIVKAPADISRRTAGEAEEIARTAVQTLNGAGVFALELFDTGESLVINEMAPRVHNSGHWTIEGAETSQFEQHVRAVMGLPLGPTTMRSPAAVMINILGENPGLAGESLVGTDLIDAVRAVPEAHIHLYGKLLRVARKVGHITVLGSDMASAEAKALEARRRIIA